MTMNPLASTIAAASLASLGQVEERVASLGVAAESMERVVAAASRVRAANPAAHPAQTTTTTANTHLGTRTAKDTGSTSPCILPAAACPRFPRRAAKVASPAEARAARAALHLLLAMTAGTTDMLATSGTEFTADMEDMAAT